MTNFLPLVPGCTALIIKGTMSGHEVTCLHYLGKPDPAKNKARICHEDCWEIDTMIPWVNKKGDSIMLNVFPAIYLMRTDGSPAESYAARQEATKIADPIT